MQQKSEYFMKSPLASSLVAVLLAASVYLHGFQEQYAGVALVMGIAAVVVTIFLSSGATSFLVTLVCCIEAGFSIFRAASAGAGVFETVYKVLLVVIAAMLVMNIKRLYRKIMFEQLHFNSLFTHATEGILVIDAAGDIILANPALQRIFGYTVDELRGHKMELLLPEDIRERHVQFRTAFVTMPQNRTMGNGRELFGLRKDGVCIPLEISLGHYRHGGEIFIIGFVVDITLRKQIETQLLAKNRELEQVTLDIRKLNSQLETRVGERTLILQEALQKLEQSQKELMQALDKEKQLNEVKSRFVSMASHEFKTPLSTVLSSAALLGKYTLTEEQDKRNRHVNKIKDAVRHLDSILNDFLVFGKLEQGRMMPVNITRFDAHELMGEVLEELDHLKKEGQQVHVSCKGDCGAATDVTLVRNIMINLLSNAFKYSGTGATIWVDGVLDERQIRISVKDTGMGIAEADQQHLFTTFYRGANAMNIQGTGLGLHIIKRYLDFLGGEITVQSQLNKGSVFTVIIPNKMAETYEKNSDH